MANTIKKLWSCRICKSTDIKVLFAKEGFDIAKCNNCTLVFLDFEPDANFFTEYYSKDFFNDPGTKHAYSDYEKESESLKKSFELRIKRMKKYIADNSVSLLDIGCATGTFLEATPKSWNAHGIDVSEYATQMARNKGLDVYTGVLENSPFFNQQFDVVTLWDTIEHVADPLNTIKQAYNITKPGGIVVLTTGDVESLISRMSGKYWHLFNIPQHLSFLSKKTITKCFNDAGLEVEEISYLPINLTLDYVLFRFITFYKLDFVLPIYKKLKSTGILDLQLNINLYDIMFAIGKKPKQVSHKENSARIN